MTNSNLVAELKRQIAEHEAASARLQEELAYQERLENDGHFGSSKLPARSLSTAGHAMATQSRSQASNDEPAPKRKKRAMSQQVTHQMSRNTSNRPETGPFLQTGAALQPLPTPSRQGLNVLQTQDKMHHHPQDGPAMPDVGVRPDVFLAGLGPDHPYIPALGVEFSPVDLSNTLSVSKCPSMSSGWSAGDGLTPMTRQNSLFDDNMVSGLDMSRWASESQSSRGFDDLMFSQGHQAKNPCVEQDFLGVGANLASTDMTRSFSSSLQSQMLLSPPDSGTDSTAMERSDSNETTSSVRSTASSKRRHKEALERVIKASRGTLLAPKPHPSGAEKPRAVLPAKKEGKVAVPPKPVYARRKPTKVYCGQCNEHPDGFRGDHELRRHCLSKHEVTVKKFICRDPASVGIPTNLKAIKPLSDCKACRAEKPYGAYYNAAAHLRRQHFKPRSTRSKGKSEEKRGGKGGGDWPPMQELKDWFEVRRVPLNQAEGASAEHEDDGSDPTDGDMEELDPMAYSLESTTTPYDIVPMGDGNMLSLDATAASAAASFGLDQFADVSSVPEVMTGFVDEGQLYDSTFSAVNAVISSNLQDMGQLSW